MAASEDTIDPPAQTPDGGDKQPAGQEEASGMDDASSTANGVVASPQAAPDLGPVELQPTSDRGDMEQLTGFLIGVLLLAPELVVQHIRDVRGQLDQQPELLAQPKSLSEASAGDLARYLAIGLTMRGQARLLQGVRRGAKLSLDTANWSLGFLDRATGGWLMRPIRRPIESRLQRLGRKTGQVIREGQLEEQKDRLLAQEVIFETVDDVIEFVADNPEVAAWIREVIGGQSVNLAVSMRDNARQLTVASDGRAEDLVRRVLRRPPRRVLPESPLAGESQTMYSPESAAEMVQAHEQRAGDPE